MCCCSQCADNDMAMPDSKREELKAAFAKRPDSSNFVVSTTPLPCTIAISPSSSWNVPHPPAPALWGAACGGCLQLCVTADGRSVEQVNFYPDTFHGFAVRGDEKVQAIKAAKQKALHTTVEFFNQHL